MMNEGDSLEQHVVSMGIGFAKNSSINMTTNINYEQVFKQLVQKIEESSSTNAEKAEARSMLAQLLQHPVISAIVGGLASTLKF